MNLSTLCDTFVWGIPPHSLARDLIPRATFRRQTFISAAPAMKRRLHSSCSPHFVIAGALSPYMPLKARESPRGSAPRPALRHSGRTFTVHAAESARITKGLCPSTPRGALCPSTQNVYNKMRRVLRAKPQRSAQYYIKARGAGMSSPPGCRGSAPARYQMAAHRPDKGQKRSAYPARGQEIFG